MKDTDSEALLLMDDFDPEEAAGLRALKQVKSRKRAIDKATRFMASEGLDQVVDAETALWNPVQRLWILPARDPARSLDALDAAAAIGELIVGGVCVVVPDEGEVYAIRSAPSDEWRGIPSAAEAAGFPEDWAEVLDDEVRETYWCELMEFVAAERAAVAGNPDDAVYPEPADVFNAFHQTRLDDIKVVIVGQDPYFNPKEAHGLAFSVRDGVKWPPSLKAILNELTTDLALPAPPTSGDLTPWANRGVLLLNTALTVRRSEKAESHLGHGWERFTDAVIGAVSDNLHERVVFVLWGQEAQGKDDGRLIDRSKHKVIKGAHPRARLTARDQFPGSRPFTTINQLLAAEPNPRTPIDWQLP